MSTIKVGVLLTALTALFLWLGHFLGGQTGMFIALALALVMNFGSYWFSDKLVIAMTGAKPVNPESAPELVEMIERLSARASIPAPKLYVVDDPSPNAFATGRNPQRGVVAVNTGLLRILGQSEVEGVVAHELAHIKHRDTLTMAIVASIAGAVMMISTLLRFATFFSSSEDGENPLALLAISIIAPLAATLVQLGISRAREYEADRMGAEIAGSPHGLANALRKLERGVDLQPGHMAPQTAHLCIVNPFGTGASLMNLFRTHPTTEDRVQRLLAMAR